MPYAPIDSPRLLMSSSEGSVSEGSIPLLLLSLLLLVIGPVLRSRTSWLFAEVLRRRRWLVDLALCESLRIRPPALLGFAAPSLDRMPWTGGSLFTVDSGSSHGPGVARCDGWSGPRRSSGDDRREGRSGLGAADDTLRADAGVTVQLCGVDVLTGWVIGKGAVRM